MDDLFWLEQLTRLRKENAALNEIVMAFIRDHVKKTINTRGDVPFKNVVDYEIILNGEVYQNRVIVDKEYEWTDDYKELIDDSSLKSLRAYLIKKFSGGLL